MATIYVTRGDLDGAMKLYQQSLEIFEGLGDLKGKSATLHAMAYIYVTRGDLDGAMKLYQQSLEIKEGLGDLQGKSATLANMGVVLVDHKQYPLALRSLVEALITFEGIGARPDAQSVANLLIQFRQALGTGKFDALWHEEIGQPLPDWLAQAPQQEQGSMSAGQFIAQAVQAAREQRPEAEQYFKAAQQMASDRNAPTELKELGKVLQKIMLGDTKVELSNLPPELAELVRKAMG
jgi:tetratricopeptide (TPR) repeat protein